MMVIQEGIMAKYKASFTCLIWHGEVQSTLDGCITSAQPDKLYFFLIPERSLYLVLQIIYLCMIYDSFPIPCRLLKHSPNLSWDSTYVASLYLDNSIHFDTGPLLIRSASSPTLPYFYQRLFPTLLKVKARLKTMGHDMLDRCSHTASQ